MDGLPPVDPGFAARHRPLARRRARGLCLRPRPLRAHPVRRDGPARRRSRRGPRSPPIDLARFSAAAVLRRPVRRLLHRESELQQASRKPMATHTFFCVDGHTCGNPVRLVAGGGPPLVGRHHGGEARAFPRRVRLDPHRPDVRAARPRHDVGRDPLPADPAGLRHRLPVHRDLRLPAHVRPRHHRHGDHGAGARAGDAARAGPAAHRHAGRPGRGRATSRTGRYVESVASPTSPSFLHSPRAHGRGRGPGRARRRRRLWRQLLRHRRAAEELPRPGACRAVRHPALEPERARRLPRDATTSCIPRTRPSTACPTSCGPARRRSPRRTPATPCSTATRRSTARPAAPAPRPAWRSGRRRAG